MNKVKRSGVLLTLFLLLSIVGHTQWGVIAKWFTKNETKYVRIVERTPARGEIVLAEHADASAFDYLDKFKQAGKKEVALTSKMIDEMTRTGKLTEEQAQKERHWLASKEIINKMFDNEAMMRDIDVPGKYFYDAPETFILIPQSEQQYISIFKEYNKRQFDDTKYVFKRLAEKDKEVMYPVAAASFITSISREDYKPIIIIGHNEKGNLYFPDGSTASIKEIDAVGKKFKRIIVYLSCNAVMHTENPAVKGLLSYQQALVIRNYIQAGSKFFIESTPGEIKKTIQTRINLYQVIERDKAIIKASAYSIGTSGALYGVYLIKKEQD